MGNGCNSQMEGYATRWHVRKHIQTTKSQKDIHPFCSFICWIFMFQASAWLWPNVLYIFLIWRHKHFIWNFKENVTILLQEVKEREKINLSDSACKHCTHTGKQKRCLSVLNNFVFLSALPFPFLYHFRSSNSQPRTNSPSGSAQPNNGLGSLQFLVRTRRRISSCLILHSPRRDQWVTDKPDHNCS